MEIKIHLHKYVILLSTLLLLLLPSIAVCKYNGTSDIVDQLWSKKYLSESYFDKHDSLLDSDFQSYLDRELPLASCKELDNLNSLVTISVLQRRLIGEGSHRRLSSSIKFNIQPEAISRLTSCFCKAVILERLPPGVFADPFELQHLVQRGVLVDAAVFGDTNLELPLALSNRSIVEVHMDIGQISLSGHTDDPEIKVELPLHARYPPLGEIGYFSVEMGIPDLFIQCSIERKENCLLMKKAEHIESPSDAVTWKIPSGNKAHSRFVSALTFISAFLSTLLIVIATIYSSDSNRSRNSKKS